MIGYTRFGNQDRRNVEIPASWKQAISLIFSQYDKMTLNRVKEPEASPPEPTAHGTIGASPDDNPRVRHDAPMAEPEASTSHPTAHGTIGASSDGNPSVRHDGVTVSQVVTGGPADQIGIKVGDVILAIDDHYLYTIEELNNATGRCKPGSTIKIRYRQRRNQRSSNGCCQNAIMKKTSPAKCWVRGWVCRRVVRGRGFLDLVQRTTKPTPEGEVIDEATC